MSFYSVSFFALSLMKVYFFLFLNDAVYYCMSSRRNLKKKLSTFVVAAFYYTFIPSFKIIQICLYALVCMYNCSILEHQQFDAVLLLCTLPLVKIIKSEFL